MYSIASFISRCSIFLPRYSGVRPTMRPAMKTESRTKTSMPYRPAPTPPKITSPSWMFTSGTRPPSGVKLSCIELTAPHEASVVTVANKSASGDAEADFLAFHVAGPPGRRRGRA